MRILLLLLLFVAGCQRETLVERANREQKLIVSVGVDPETLDPQLFSSTNSLHVIRALFDGLMRPNAEGEAEMGLAERCERSPDGLTYTFYLREGRWSNGDLVCAQDFCFAYERILSPNLASPNAQLLYVLKNAKMFAEGKCAFADVGVKRIDDRTLALTLEQPPSYFLSLLYHPAWFPLNKGSVLKHGAIDDRNNEWAEPQNIVTNGAFCLDEAKQGQFIEVRKNPSYWNAAAIQLAKIRFEIIPDNNTEERAFRNHRLHVTETVPFSKIAYYQKERPKCVVVTPSRFSYYYLLNVDNPTLSSKDVRQALSLALDRESLRNLRQVPAFRLLPDYTRCPALTTTEFNPDKAKACLARAGYPNGKGFPKLTLTINNMESHKKTAEKVQEMWRKHLNIFVEIESLDWKVYLSRRRSGEFEIARGGWFADYNDPLAFLEIWKSHAANNYTHWSSETFDALLDASSHQSQGARTQTLAEAEKVLLEASPLIPLYFVNEIRLVDESVQHWKPNLLGWHLYEHVEVQQSKGLQ